MISRREFIGSLIFSGFAFIFSDSLFFEKFFIETNEFEIGPADRIGPKIKLLQISDLHLQKISWHHEQLAGRVNAMQPDLLLFTGDIIDREDGPRLLDDFLKLLDHDIKKVAVAGNWEHAVKINFRALRAIYRNHNCELLVNQSTSFMFHGKRLVVTGIDDMMTGHPDFPAAVKNMSRGERHIVLCHCPLYLDTIKAETGIMNRGKTGDNMLKVDYVFSGHSHGGQVNIFGYTPFLPSGVGKYVRGWYEKGSPKLYVSKGIGTSIFPVRIGSRAEIALFNYNLA